MRRHYNTSLPLSPPKPKLKRPYVRRLPPEVIAMREPAPKMRLTREDCYRSPGGRGYDQR